MIRLLLVLLILFLIVYGITKWLRYKFKKHLENIFPQSKQPSLHHDLVCCKTCQLYLPKDQAFLVNDCYYCCKEHSKVPPT